MIDTHMMTGKETEQKQFAFTQSSQKLYESNLINCYYVEIIFD